MNYFSDWTYEDVQKHNMKIKGEKAFKLDFENNTSNLSRATKKSKYGANKCEYEGIKFDGCRYGVGVRDGGLRIRVLCLLWRLFSATTA